MPSSTDLVTDLPADFEVFGQAVDTSLADLKGGTTGQVLSKASNTDMDFTWVAQDDSNAIQNAIVDAKGDLIAATAADTPARLAVGTNGQYLSADSTAATGLAWATPVTGMTQLATGTLSGSTVTLSSISSSYKDLYLVLENWQGSAGDQPYVYLNTDAAANYDTVTMAVFNNSSVGRADSATSWISRIGMAGYSHPTGSNGNFFTMQIFDYANTISYKYANTGGACLITSGSNYQGTWFGAGAWRNTSAVNQIVLKTASGSFGGGTYYLYGVK